MWLVLWLGVGEQVLLGILGVERQLIGSKVNSAQRARTTYYE
jgi:hypothetical protein